MIFVHDKGQMCNNILQYAHVYAWARENNRKSVSMRFAYKYQYFNICSSPYHNFLMYIVGKYGSKLHLLPTVHYDLTQEGKTEKEKYVLSHRNVVMEGWGLRYYDLYMKYIEEIKQLFEFTDAVRSKVSNVLSVTSDSDTLRIGVHIRRGDYKTFFHGRYFFDDDAFVHYIKEVIRLFPHKKVSVYICGNDRNLNKAYYQDAVPGATVLFPDGNPGEDLCLLSECDYLIGPPSSFSLIATMYGRAKLYWMTSSDTCLTVEDFKDFDTLFRIFDDCFKE